MIKFLKWPKMCQHLTAGVQAERAVVFALRTCGFSGPRLLLGTPGAVLPSPWRGCSNAGAGPTPRPPLKRARVISERGKHLLLDMTKLKRFLGFLAIRFDLENLDQMCGFVVRG